MGITLPDTERQRLNAAWQIAEQAGLQKARKNQTAALEAYEEALTIKRAAEEIVRAAQGDHDDALSVVTYQLAGRFTVRSNKTYLDTDPERSFTAAEKTAWIALEASKDVHVRTTASTLRAATDRLEEARDRIAVSERRIAACKSDLAAAVSLTDLLAITFKGQSHDQQD